MIKISHRSQKKITFFSLFLGLCVVAGIGSGYFTLITNQAYLWLKALYQQHPYSMLVYIPAMFMLIVFLLKRYFPHASGSGLPQGYALDVYDSITLKKTYSLRTMAGKILLTILSIGSGASLGREGPIIQICAAIFGSMPNISIQRQKMLIRIGSGVGVATAFNAPLGGVIFAFEEYLKTSKSAINGLLLLGIGIAGYMGTWVYGDYFYMGGVPLTELSCHAKTMLLAVMSGAICGLAGALFTWIMVYVTVNKGQVWHAIRKKYAVLWAFVFGLGVAIVGIMSHGYSFGNGAVETKEVLVNGLNLPWYYGLAKCLGSVFSVSAGVPGGYFSTALSIGAGIMDSIYRLWPVLPVEQFYLLGMVGFLAAITDAPITAVTMIISTVDNSQHFILPIMVTSLFASYIATRFGDSVYHQQVLNYIDPQRYRETL